LLESESLSVILRIPVDRELSERAMWLVTFRWLVLTAATVFVLGANLWLGNVLPQWPLLVTLAIIGLYNLVFRHAIQQFRRRGPSHNAYACLVHIQIAADLLALTTLLHFSGGLENPFSPYYLLIVTVGSLLMGRRDSYAYAALASCMWLAMLLAEATGIVPHYNLAGFRAPERYRQIAHIVANGAVISSACFASAYLASGIIERLRAGERQLLEATQACELRATELGHLNERLREVDQTRSAFIRLVTHELRAPVAAIQSYLRLILDGYVPESRIREIIAKAELRANDQLELISDLLDLARVQQPGAQEQVEPCDAADILSDVMDMMQARIQDKKLSTRVEMCPGDVMVPASEEHMRQIWINLISNAIKYTPEGGAVTVRLSVSDGQVQGSVEDTGIGIGPDDLSRIFETFYRTESAKEMSVRGTGLGLSIVKGIVERYGGRIWVNSQEGQGSTFFFELPEAAAPVQLDSDETGAVAAT
jgi:signal transduction histidine kinase